MLIYKRNLSKKPLGTSAQMVPAVESGDSKHCSKQVQIAQEKTASIAGINKAICWYISTGLSVS